jgi:hypothetical protein
MHGHSGMTTAWRARPLFGFALAVTLAAACAAASVVQPLDLGELAAQASFVVHGRVVDVRPEWVRGGRQIDSIVTVEVENAWKGAPSRRLSFVSPGGQIGPYRTIVPGAPDFASGAELVLFLDGGRGLGPPTLVGLAQGALPVLAAGDGQKRVRVPLLVPGLADAHLPVRVSVTLGELGETLAHALAARQRRAGAGR